MPKYTNEQPLGWGTRWERRKFGDVLTPAERERYRLTGSPWGSEWEGIVTVCQPLADFVESMHRLAEVAATIEFPKLSVPDLTVNINEPVAQDLHVGMVRLDCGYCGSTYLEPWCPVHGSGGGPAAGALRC